MSMIQSKPAMKARIPGPAFWGHRSACSLEISMNNPRQDGRYLASQIDLVNRRFKRCFIHMGDTLQRHNLLGRLSPDDARLASYIMGSAWLARNADILEKLEIPYDIIRWDHWLEHPDFPELHAALRAYYDSNVFFRKIVGRDVALFLERNPQADPARCVDYLLEEAAADTLFARQTPTVRLYPASELATYAHLSKTDIPSPLKGLNRGVHVRISFHRRKDGGAITESAATESGFMEQVGALPTEKSDDNAYA